MNTIERPDARRSTAPLVFPVGEAVLDDDPDVLEALEDAEPGGDQGAEPPRVE